MKVILHAKQRLRATEQVGDLLKDNGTAFDLLMDGKEDAAPAVQELTVDDGGVETPEEKHLLEDDLQTLEYPTEKVMASFCRKQA
jgi:hypothetical protein